MPDTKERNPSVGIKIWGLTMAVRVASQSGESQQGVGVEEAIRILDNTILRKENFLLVF